MNFDILAVPFQYYMYNSGNLVENYIAGDMVANPVATWLTFGKLPQNFIVTPTAYTQVIRPTSLNRYISSVTINPIPTSSTTTS